MKCMKNKNTMVLTCPFWSQKVEILNIFSECFNIFVNSIRGHTANLDQAIMLDEDGVTGQVPMDNRLLK